MATSNRQAIIQVSTNGLPLRVRTGPGLQYSVIGSNPNETTMKGTKMENGWWYHESTEYAGAGWSSGEFISVLKWLDPPPVKNKASKSPSNSATGSPSIYSYNWNKQELENEFFNVDAGFGGGLDGESTLFQLQGLPFQYLPLTDPRCGNSVFGRTFMENILSDGAVIFFEPGVPRFNYGISKQDQQQLAVGLANEMKGVMDPSKLTSSIMDASDGRYYMLKNAYADYINYVNSFCTISSVIMGLGSVTNPVFNRTYAHMDWGNFMSGDDGFSNNQTGGYKNKASGISGIATRPNPLGDSNHNPCVAFFGNVGGTSASVSFSNGTTKSVIDQYANKFSSAAKEARYLFGEKAGAVKGLDLSNYDSTVRKILTTLGGSHVGGGIANATNMISNSITDAWDGGDVDFPDLWESSNTSKTIDISFKLVSPYGDRESIFLNVLVPLYFLLGLTLPREIGIAGYISPFLVRTYCQGYFECDMGIVNNFTFTKAPNRQWSIDGLPLEVDISMSIHPMYETISMSKFSKLKVLDNIGFLDMLSTMSGVNIRKPSIVRAVNIYRAWTEDKLLNTPRNFKRYITSDVIEYVNGLFS